MATEDIVSTIMATLRELHPELPEPARVNLELDLRRMEPVPTKKKVKSNEARPRPPIATRRTPTPRTERSPRGEREPLGFAELGNGFNKRK